MEVTHVRSVNGLHLRKIQYLGICTNKVYIGMKTSDQTWDMPSEMPSHENKVYIGI